jgi:RNA polymerase-binding transcription factor DksA
VRSLGLNNMPKDDVRATRQDKSASDSKTKLGRPKSFGKCRKCGGAIAIPGLDASLCAEFCGWVQAKACFDNLAKETKKT